MKIEFSIIFKKLALLACLTIFFYGNAQVGIETSDPLATLDVNGALSLREGPKLTLVDNNNNNIDLGTTPHSFYRIVGPSDSFNITGIASLNAVDGQLVTLQNTTSAIMTLLNQNNNSTGPNRIWCSKQSDLMVRGKYATVTLQYNATKKKWFVMSSSDTLETWYVYPVELARNTATTISVNFPGLSKHSGFTVNFAGPALNNAMINNLTIEYKEARDNEMIFRVHNISDTSSYSGLEFIITLFK